MVDVVHLVLKLLHALGVLPDVCGVDRVVDWAFFLTVVGLKTWCPRSSISVYSESISLASRLLTSADCSGFVVAPVSSMVQITSTAGRPRG